MEEFLSMSKSVVFVLGLILLAGCSKLTDQQLWDQGVDAQKAEKFTEALQSYQQLLDDYPKSPKVPEALYAIGSICQNKNLDIYRAIRSYRRIVDEYPTHATATSALFLVGFIYNNELKNVDSARIAYEEFLKKYPDNTMAESARFELANLGKSPNEIIELKSQPLAKSQKKAPAKKTGE
jgi:TolA-binding protein